MDELVSDWHSWRPEHDLIDPTSVSSGWQRFGPNTKCEWDDPDNGGWPDLRNTAINAPIPDPPYHNAWCAGGEGIALSRAAALQFTDEAFIRDDLDFALAQIEGIEKDTPSGGRRRHLCCGTSGRAEMFLSLSGLLDRDDLAETGRSIAPPEAATGLRRTGVDGTVSDAGLSRRDLGSALDALE